jgi:hypothetical protein
VDIEISKFYRIRPEALDECDIAGDESVLVGPSDLVMNLRPRVGLVVAAWDASLSLGCARRLGVVLGRTEQGVRVRWSASDAKYRPAKSARQFWAGEKPFFKFHEPVAARYMLSLEFAEHFPCDLVFDARPSRAKPVAEVRPSSNPRGGYVYLVKSEYGIKIGKAVNVKSRTKLFEVKLPFPITVEHYAWFDDYSLAERDLHKKYHAQRLEGEWFNLSSADVAHIKTLGNAVAASPL